MPSFRIETESELAVALQRLGELSPKIEAQQAEFNQLLAAIDTYQSRFITDQEQKDADVDLAAEAVREGRLVDPKVVHDWMKKLHAHTKD